MKTYNRKPLTVEAEQVRQRKSVVVEGFELNDSESMHRVTGIRSCALPGDWIVYMPGRNYPVIMGDDEFRYAFEV